MKKGDVTKSHLLSLYYVDARIIVSLLRSRNYFKTFPKKKYNVNIITIILLFLQGLRFSLGHS